MYRRSCEMVEGDDNGNGYNIFEEVEEPNTSSGRSFLTGDNGTKRKKRSVFDICFEEVQALLTKFPIAPTAAIRNHPEFLKNRILINPRNNQYIETSIRYFGNIMNAKSLKEFDEFYSQENVYPIFMHGQTYHSREESFEIINNLLKFQFNDEEDLITEFLTTLVDVIDRRLPKLNTIVIYSPQSGGKNFFFEMIFGFMLSYGQLGTANKHNQFAFQDAANQRIILWDEPNYESGITDYLKKVLGASPYSVRAKGLPDIAVKRTPVVVLTNTTVNFMVDVDFSERLKIYYWKTAHMLADIMHKPYPLVFFDILKKYNIQY